MLINKYFINIQLLKLIIFYCNNCIYLFINLNNYYVINCFLKNANLFISTNLHDYNLYHIHKNKTI